MVLCHSMNADLVVGTLKPCLMQNNLFAPDPSGKTCTMFPFFWVNNWQEKRWILAPTDV